MNKKRIPFAAMTSAAVITSFVAAPLAPLAEKFNQKVLHQTLHYP